MKILSEGQWVGSAVKGVGFLLLNQYTTHVLQRDGDLLLLR